MLNEETVREQLKSVQDPDLHKSLVETGGIREVKIKEGYVGLKIALAQINTAEQMQVQQEIVNKLKSAGADSVGLRFEALSEEELDKFGGIAEEEEDDGSLLTKGSKTTFIAVASGKGGVGKSTVTVNLATALQRLGKKVGIVDADIYGFSVPDMMGIETRPRVEGNKIFPVERFGVKVISMGFFVEDNSPVIWRGPMLGKMLNNFFNEVEWGDLDYLLLDLPPGTGDMALDVHTMLPSCKEIIVTTPHATAAFVAARAGAMALKTEHEIIGVVENMAYFESELTGEKEYVFGKGGGEKLSEELNTELLGQVPLAQPAEREDGTFAPGVYEEDEPIGKIYREIAEKVAAKAE
ncbi:MAG TPA: Mrp/NBP35 family ATP-binding protein [Bacillales bacterium]|nr:Mrp/NBP35 family ATP-binding protein [Bacillales bacterium]